MASMAMATLFLRVLCLMFLLISLIILATNSKTYQYHDWDYMQFKKYNSYLYMMCTLILIGFAYTLLQIPFAVQLIVSSGKPSRLVGHDGLIKFGFYGYKIISALLAMGVGAGFCATSDNKQVMDDIFEDEDYHDYRSKFHEFFNMANFSACFLLIAFFCIEASSIISSLTLAQPDKQENTVNTDQTQTAGTSS